MSRHRRGVSSQAAIGSRGWNRLRRQLDALNEVLKNADRGTLTGLIHVPRPEAPESENFYLQGEWNRTPRRDVTRGGARARFDGLETCRRRRTDRVLFRLRQFLAPRRKACERTGMRFGEPRPRMNLRGNPGVFFKARHWGPGDRGVKVRSDLFGVS